MQHVPWQRHSKKAETKEKEVMRLRRENRFDDFSNQKISEIIDEWIPNERNRAIMKRRFIDGICYEPLAEEFDLSVTHIKRIVYKNENRIYNHLGL